MAGGCRLLAEKPKRSSPESQGHSSACSLPPTRPRQAGKGRPPAGRCRATDHRRAITGYGQRIAGCLCLLPGAARPSAGKSETFKSQIPRPYYPPPVRSPPHGPTVWRPDGLPEPWAYLLSPLRLVPSPWSLVPLLGCQRALDALSALHVYLTHRRPRVKPYPLPRPGQRTAAQSRPALLLLCAAARYDKPDAPVSGEVPRAARAEVGRANRPAGFCFGAVGASDGMLLTAGIGRTAMPGSRLSGEVNPARSEAARPTR